MFTRGHRNATGVSTVFDIGMYDGSDTEYYLDCGLRVIAVEANPTYVQRAKSRFCQYISSGQLTIVQAAIAEREGQIRLAIDAVDPGSSSVCEDRMHAMELGGSFTVPALKFEQLVMKHGKPDFLKVDIEGADRFCILALTPANAPTYLSFEIGSDFEELLLHVAGLGFSRFKIIDQACFRNMRRVNHLGDRIATRLSRMLGYAESHSMRRSGRFFRIASSGPAPWASDGRWESADSVRSLWRDRLASGHTPNWYDLIATRLG